VLTQQWRGAARARAALGAYAALLAWWTWRPFWPRTNWAEVTVEQFVPLASVAMRADVFSALHVLQLFALYVPLGALLAVWPLQSRGWRAHVRPALLLALVLELGHLVIAERTFDVTNVLLAGAGVLLGWTVVRRAGFVPYGEALRPR
jgi:glycopeptide antibiotics resistance protein